MYFCNAGGGITTISLADVIKADFINYFKRRGEGTYGTKEKQRAKSTVARERNILQVAFRTAIEENYFGVCHSLANPVHGIRIEGSMHSRRRGLLEGEQEKIETEIFDKLLGLNRYYIPLAFYLAIDTGMRQQEIINLTWDDINFERRRIKIRKSKTDRKLIDKGHIPGRTIVLPITAAYYLLVLRNSIHTYSRLPALELLAVPPIESSNIFINSEGRPWTPKAVSKAWAEAVKQSSLELYNGENLRFHDLRRAANDRFIRANLEPKEQDMMLGHANNSMNDIYKSDDALDYMLTNIQRRLDRYILGEELEAAYSTAVDDGFTLKEYAFIGGNPYLPSKLQRGGFKQEELKLALEMAINLFVLKPQIEHELWDDILSYLKDNPGERIAPDIATLVTLPYRQ
jgi:integrase